MCIRDRYTSPILFPLTNQYVFPIMIYSSLHNEENITFEYYNSIEGITYNLNHGADFESDMIIGDGFTPFSFDGHTGQTSNEVTSNIPVEFDLAHPNPFNPITSINYTVNKSSDIKVAIYDITGRLIEVIENGHKGIGEYSLTWDAANHSSGVYYIQIQNNNNVCLLYTSDAADE